MSLRTEGSARPGDRSRPTDSRPTASRPTDGRLTDGRPTASRVMTSLAAARDRLLGLQDPAGWWKGELQTNVTMDAEDLLLRHILGVLEPEQSARAAVWIRSQQRADGTWASFEGGPADLSTTVEAYVALRLAGERPEQPNLRSAAHYIREAGGIEASRVFTRIWLAMVGQWPWEQLPSLPPEMIMLPTWVPLNVYDFGCWARQTLVPLTIVSALQPVHPLPFSLDEIRTGRNTTRQLRRLSKAAGFLVVDKLLLRYARHPVKRLRDAAIARSAEWIVRRQEADGSWGGIQPPWVYSLIALREVGYPMDHPVMARGLAGLDRFTIDDEHGRRLEACQSPVWDTVLAMIALTDAAVAPEHEAVHTAAEWLLREEITVRGDWAVRRPGLAAGGWAFEFDNDGYPDVDDTAEAVLALHRLAATDADGRIAAAIDRGVAWSVGMQSSDGGWGAFDADNTRDLAYQIPFADFGAMIDPPSADVTAHMVEMLGVRGRGGDVAAQRGVRWLLDAQEDDGSWFGRWGANYVYGTGAVVPALIAVGIGASHPAITRAVDWLHRVQNADGGWGEDLRSYEEPKAWRARGDSTPSQTAWALLALLAVDAESEAVGRGIDWLLRTQRDDGGWDEPKYTGTGFPGAFYINYHLYRIVFPLTALGRYVRATAARTGSNGNSSAVTRAGTAGEGGAVRAEGRRS